MIMSMAKKARNLLTMIGLVLIFVGASAAVPGQELIVTAMVLSGMALIGAAGAIDWLADRYAA